MSFFTNAWHQIWDGLMQTSIITGWLPLLFEVLAIATLALSIDWRSPKARRQLGLGALGSAVIVGILLAVLKFGHFTPDGFSYWPYVWAMLVGISVWTVFVGWTAASAWRRTAGISAVVFTLICTLGAINVSTQTFITVYRLFSGHSEGVFHLAGIEKIKAEVARTGKLPARGQLFITSIPGTTSGFKAHDAYIWLPPVWFKTPTPSLPAIILLPGEPGSASDWSSSGDADTTADVFAAQHGGVAPIIIMPDPNGFKTVDTECVNSQFGNAETYLAKDIPAFAENNLNVSSASGALAIGGLSAGGTCSAILALNYPDVYKTFASYSGFDAPQYQDDSLNKTIEILFGNSKEDFDQHSPLWLLEHHSDNYRGMGAWFESGLSDPATVAAAKALQPPAARAGIATCITIKPGGHDFVFWSQAFTDSLPWLSWQIGLTPKPSKVPASCTYP